MSRWRWTGLCLVIYLAAALALFPVLRHDMNPDGARYITVAEKYLGGHFAAALNAYWSPLFSWLLVPMLRLVDDPVAAAKLLMVLVGAAAVPVLARLGSVIGLTETARRVMLVTAVPVLLSIAYAYVSPDLLLAVMVMAYLAAIGAEPSRLTDRRVAALGILGALAYFAKGLALPLFLSHFTLLYLGLIRAHPANRRALLRRYGVGLAWGSRRG